MGIYIVEIRTRLSHAEDGAVDILSFKVAYNTPRKMVAEISSSVGPWGRW